MTIDVHLWWIGADAPDERLMSTIRGSVEEVFELRARSYHHGDRPTQAFDPRRGQHSSTQILKWLVQRQHSAERILAVTDVDLFIPVLTFVYGEAQLGGHAAIVSTARLSVEPDTPSSAALFEDRVVKECVHELGHTFGLIHCDTAGCVMTRSVNLLEVDAKRISLCTSCGAQYMEFRHKDGHYEQGPYARPRR